MQLQRLTQRNEKAMASSDKTAKAVFKVHAARGLKVRRVSKKESKVTFNDLGKERSSTSRRDFSGQLSVKVLEEDPKSKPKPKPNHNPNPNPSPSPSPSPNPNP